MQLKVKKLHPEAQLPEYKHQGDAGMNLYSPVRIEIAPHSRVIVPSGIAMAVPEGYVGLIWDRSGMAAKNGIKTMAGVLDAGYRGEIGIVLLNTTDALYIIEKGDKIAQMLIQPVVVPEIIEAQELDATSRGEGGFGSTGR